MLGSKRIQPLTRSQTRGLAKAQAGGTASDYLASHPGVAKHTQKVAARKERQEDRLEATKRPLGGMSGGNPNPNKGYTPIPGRSKKPYNPSGGTPL
jgi:hypothetical protein